MTHPAPVQRLPDIDPAEHALESRSWGEEFTFHLVSYDGRYYAWTVRPWDDGDHAYEMPSRQDARQFLDSEFAFLLTVTDWGERVASAHVGDGATGQILFSADVLDGAEDGIWLATSEADGEESTYALAGFDDLGAAVAAFAARSEQAADAIERLDLEGTDAREEGRAAAATAGPPGPGDPRAADGPASLVGRGDVRHRCRQRAGSQGDRGRRPRRDGCDRHDPRGPDRPGPRGAVDGDGRRRSRQRHGGTGQRREPLVLPGPQPRGRDVGEQDDGR